MLAFVLSLLAVVAVLALAGCGGETAVTPSSDLSSGPAGASPMPAVTVGDQERSNKGLVEGVYGTEFRPLVDVEVGALGLYDDNGNGLRQAHRVGIFERDSKQSVVDVIIRPDSTLEGEFRWEPVESVLLKTGKSYIVASDNFRPFDTIVHGRGDWPLTLDPGSCWSTGRLRDKSWRYPDKPTKLPLIGPNFKFTPLSAASP